MNAEKDETADGVVQIDKQDVIGEYGIECPREEYLDTEELLAVAEKTPGELEERFWTWVYEEIGPGGLGEFLDLSGYKRVYYHIPSDEIRKNRAPSKYHNHAVDANDDIVLMTRDGNGWEAGYSVDDMMSALAALVNDPKSSSEYFEERYSEYAGKLAKCDKHRNDIAEEERKQARHELNRDEEFQEMYHEDTVRIEFETVAEYADLKEMLEVDIAGDLRRQIKRDRRGY